MNVFVYGTLKKGYYNNYYLWDAEYLRKDAMIGAMVDLGSFPGVVIAPEELLPFQGIVEGEVYTIGNKIMQKLDALEGHPEFYKREELSLLSGEKAWVYIFQGDIRYAPIITNGIWSKQ